MNSQKNILTAFILNLTFSIFEFIGGIFTGSTAILSDALHDLGDATGIGLSLFLEKKSKKAPDDIYTFGYRRYSVLGSLITTLILLIGSVFVIINSINKIIHPTEINYDGMIVFAVVGVIVNAGAAYLTHGGSSLNQKAVNLHMLEDVLGWVIVLLGAVVMRFTDFSLIDPIMSIGVALFIIYHAAKNLKKLANLFLMKIPDGITTEKIRDHICRIEGVIDAHHIHIWSIDGENHFSSMHIVYEGDKHKISHFVRDELQEHGIVHSVIEFESPDEDCCQKICHTDFCDGHGHDHHH